MATDSAVYFSGKFFIECNIVTLDVQLAVEVPFVG